jgi:tetratricopeptide (TPR) repeat protein
MRLHRPLAAAALAAALLLAGPAALRADDTGSKLDALEDRALREEGHAKHEQALASFQEAFGIAVKDAATSGDAARAARSRARAEVYLARVDGLAGRLTAHRRVEEFLRGFTKEELGPVLAGRVDWERVGYLRKAGKPDESLALLRSLGFVTRWWICGPFDNERERGFGAKMGPEGDKGIVLDLAASYPGKERQVSWRPVPAAHPYGWIDFDAMMRPNDQALAYAVTWIRCDEPREVALRFGSDESLAVWVNGAEVLRRDAVRRGGFDQDVAAVRFGKGWNRILVKVGETVREWGFRMRVTTPAGEPLPDLAHPATDEELAAASAAPETGAKPETLKADRGALDALEPAAPRGKTADEGSDDARAYFWLGVLHRARQYDDQKKEMPHRTYFERAAKLRPDEASYRFAAAEAHTRPIEMGVEKEENTQRRGREKTLEIDPSFAEAYVALAGYYTHSLPNLARAEDLVRKAIALQGDYLEAHLLLADILRRRGFATEASVYVDGLLERTEFGERLAFLRLLVEKGDRSGALAAAADACRKALDSDREDFDSRQRLAQVLMREGLAEDAVGVFDERARLNPFDLDALRKKATFLEGLDRHAEAAAAAAAGLAVAPEDEALLDIEARVLHRMGRKPDAVARWKEALRVNPKNAVLKRYVEWLDPSLKPFEEPYVEDAAALLAEVRDRPVDAKENDPSLVVLDRGVVRLNPDGTSSSFTQKIVKILNNQGVKDNARYFAGSFFGGEQAFEWRAARVWRKDGSVEQAQVQAGSPGVRWPKLEPGDAIEVQHRVDELRQSFFGDYYGETWSFCDRVPVVRSEWTLLVPASRRIHVNARHMPAGTEKAETAVLDDGKVVSHTWRLKELPKIRMEIAMPDTSERFPQVEVTTYADWNEFSRWWWNLIKKQFTVDDGMRAKVEELTKDAKSRLDRVRAIHDFVVSDIQYQAWEFGVHGYKPYSATAIFNRRFGDCKDKAILIRTMLDMAGIEAFPVLIMATQNRSAEDMELAQVGKFNHCIAYVPDADGNGLGLFLDGTAQYNSFRNVPTMDRGARVLIVRPDGGELATIPWNSPEDWSISQEFTVSLDGTGAATYDGKASFRGDWAVMARNMFSVEGKRGLVLAQILGPSLGKHKVESSTFPDLKDISAPEVAVGLKVGVEGLGKLEGGTKMAVPLRFVQVFPVGMIFGQITALKEREHDMVLFNPLGLRERATYRIPGGWKVAKLPDARNVETPYGRYRLSVEAKDGTVVVDRDLALLKNRITREEYPSFREMAATITASLTEKILLEKIEGGAPAGTPEKAPAPAADPGDGAGGGK